MEPRDLSDGAPWAETRPPWKDTCAPWADGEPAASPQAEPLAPTSTSRPDSGEPGDKSARPASPPQADTAAPWTRPVGFNQHLNEQAQLPQAAAGALSAHPARPSARAGSEAGVPASPAQPLPPPQAGTAAPRARTAGSLGSHPDTGMTFAPGRGWLPQADTPAPWAKPAGSPGNNPDARASTGLAWGGLPEANTPGHGASSSTAGQPSDAGTRARWAQRAGPGARAVQPDTAGPSAGHALGASPQAGVPAPWAARPGGPGGGVGGQVLEAEPRMPAAALPLPPPLTGQAPRRPARIMDEAALQRCGAVT